MSSTSFKLNGIAIAMFTFSQFAQAENAVGELEPVLVTAVSGSTLMDDKNTFTTSAMKTTTGLTLSPKDTPQSVSVITKSQLKDRAINSMPEALATTTGINVVRDSGSYRFQSRGFYIDQIEEDGIASTVSGGASGNPYRDAQSLLDLAVYDHIEVVRGATGLTQANGEPGGTINVVRKRPTSEFQANGQFSFDNWGKARNVNDVSGSLNDSQSTRGRLVTVLEHHPTAQDLDNNNRLIYGVVDTELGQHSQLTLGASYQDKHEQPDFFGVPMAEKGADAGFSHQDYLGLSWNQQKSRKWNLFAEVETFLAENWQWTNKFSYNKNYLIKAFGGLTNSSPSYAGLARGGKLAMNNLSRYDNRGDQLGFKSNLVGQYQWLGRSHDLFVDYSASREFTETLWRRVRNSSQFDPFQFEGTEIAKPDWDTAFNDRTRYDSTIYSQAVSLGSRFNLLDNLHILAGTRYTHWKRVGNTDYDIWNNKPDSDADEHTKVSRSRFVPYLGVTYDLNPNHSLYASYTTIFKPQSVLDNHNRTLDPIIGTNYELGWKSAYYNGKLNTALALFEIIQKNRPVSLKNELTGRWYSLPMGKVRSRGVDAEISGNLTEDWQLFVGYTFNRSQYLETESTRYVRGASFSKHTPKHLLRVYTSYHLPFDQKKWTIGGGVNFQSRTSSIYDVEQASYALWNANVQYQVNPHIQLRAGVNNLTNKRYFENHKVRTNGINNYLGTPRTFYFDLDWKF